MAQRPNNRKSNRQAAQQAPELEERVVYINRVSKVVKGGRRFGLTALVVVGDRNGNVGVGMGKSAEVPIAISKGVEDAKKNMFKVPLTEEGTIPHEVIGEFSAGRVLLKPATPGTGVIAGGPMRAVCDAVGIRNVVAKAYGSTNPYNLVRATLNALDNLRSPAEIAAKRGKSVEELLG